MWFLLFCHRPRAGMLENSTWIAENSGFIQAEELIWSEHSGGRDSPKVAETMFAIVPFAAVGR